MYPDGGAAAVAAELKSRKLPPRTIDAIRRRANSRRIFNSPAPQAWSQEEDNLICSKYPQGGVDACTPRLPNRSKLAIYQRACRLQVSREQPE
jgi:hypothetical protein